MLSISYLSPDTNTKEFPLEKINGPIRKHRNQEEHGKRDYKCILTAL